MKWEKENQWFWNPKKKREDTPNVILSIQVGSFECSHTIELKVDSHKLKRSQIQ